MYVGAEMICLKLQQEQWLVNYKRLERLNQGTGLQLRRRKQKKMLLGEHQLLPQPNAANMRNYHPTVVIFAAHQLRSY
ncbi:MAG TPA: hypothetical protein DIW85_20655 [Stenotrophomonas sp.]|nr:hypothetical protein [Stenotrophomonas sp.]